MLDKFDAAVRQKGCRIGCRLSCRSICAVRVSDDGRDGQLACQTESIPFRFWPGMAGRSIRSRGKYPHRHSSENTARSAPRLASCPRKLQYLGGISGKVADGGIQLRERDLHKGSIEYGAQSRFAMN